MENLELPKNQNNFSRTYLAPLFLRIDCPKCHKNYRVDTRDIKSSEPQLRCSSCESLFAFSYPPANPLKVETRLLQASILPSLDVIEKRPADVKVCPKCYTLNTKIATECGRCGVIFARIENLPLDQRLGAIPSLVRAWQDLMSDYDNLTKHLAFVNQCEELQALPYALRKYQDLKEVQPQDQIADEMLHRVVARKLARPAAWVSRNLKNSQSFNLVMRRIHWARIRKTSPWLAGGILILLGLANPSLKNLVGIGASVLFVTMGLHFFFKGKIELSDFW